MSVCEVTHLRNAGLYQTTYRDLHDESAFARVYDHVQLWLHSPAVQDECRKFAEGTRQAGEVGLKPFVIKYREEIVRVYQKGDPLLTLHNPKVQAIVESAIGPSRLLCLDLWHNPPNCCKRNPQWSQSWHRDPEESQLVKVFVYFSHVEERSGPFEYVLGSHLAWFDLCPPGTYPVKPVDAASIPSQLFVKVVGKPGTVAFAQTSGLHKGGHGEEARTMAVLTYVPEQSQARNLYEVQG